MAKKLTPRKPAGNASTRSTAGSGFASEDLVVADLLTRFLPDWRRLAWKRRERRSWCRRTQLAGPSTT